MNNDKKQICLQYLGLPRKQVEDAVGDYEASIQAVRNLHHYLGLAVEYGCSASIVTGKQIGRAHV